MTAEEATPNEETQERVPVNRREFLNFAWLVSMGFLTISVAGVTYLFVLPRFKEGEFGGVITAGTVESLPDVVDSPENFAKTKFWLSNTPQRPDQWDSTSSRGAAASARTLGKSRIQRSK